MSRPITTDGSPSSDKSSDTGMDPALTTEGVLDKDKLREKIAELEKQEAELAFPDWDDRCLREMELDLCERLRERYGLPVWGAPKKIMTMELFQDRLELFHSNEISLRGKDYFPVTVRGSFGTATIFQTDSTSKDDK